MRLIYPIKFLIIYLSFGGWFVLPIQTFGQVHKDSITHISLEKFQKQFYQTQPLAKRFIVKDSLNQKIFEINLNKQTIEKIERDRVIIINDSSYYLHKGCYFMNDTLKILTLSKPLIIDFNKGSSIELAINSESLLNEGEIEGFTNNAYNRTNINFKVLKKNLPINGGYLFNTDNFAANPLLGFYLNFDFEKYLAYKKERLLSNKPNMVNPAKLSEMQLDSHYINTDTLILNRVKDTLSTNQNRRDSLSIDSIYTLPTKSELDSTWQWVKQKKSQKDSIENVVNSARLFARSKNETDTLIELRNTFTGEINKPKVHVNSDTIQYFKKKYLNELNQKKLVSRLNRQDYGDLPLQGGIPKLNKFKGLENKWEIPKPKLKTLTLGRVFPDYGPLVLSNFSLVGLRTQLSIKNFEVDGFGGYHFQQNQENSAFQLPTKEISSSSKLLGIQPSYRINSGMRLIGTYLVGTSQNLSNVRPINFETSEYKQVRTDVVGLGFHYKISERSLLRFDWSHSLSRMGDENSNLNEKWNEKMRNAFLLEFNSTIKKTKTNLIAGIRKVDPYYFSPGTPFLRNDVVAYKLRITQPLLRNNLSISGNLEHNTDNIYRLRKSTMESNLLLFKISARLKRKVSINLISSQNFQHTYGEINVKARTSLYQGTVSKIGKSKKAMTNYMMIYSFLENNFSNNISYHHNLSLIALYNFPALGFTLTNTLSGMHSNLSDSVGFVMAEINASKSVTGWLNVSGGMNATETNFQLNRFRAFSTLNLKIGKAVISPYYERFWTFNEKKTGKNLFKINFFLILQY